MSAGSIRSELGISRDRVARWAGVSIPTLAIYERTPDAVGERKRLAISEVYEILGAALERIRARAAPREAEPARAGEASARETPANDDPPDEGARPPRTRGDCIDGPRPCPWVACRYHLHGDISRRKNSRRRELRDLPETCALDVAERGGATLEEVAAIVGLARERVRQIEVVALTRLRSRAELPEGDQ